MCILFFILNVENNVNSKHHWELQESKQCVIAKSANWCFTTAFPHSEELLDLQQILFYNSQHPQQWS